MNSNVKKLTRSGMLLAVAMVFQLLGAALGMPRLNQFFVGSVVNAVLILAASTCGLWWGIGIGVLTPLTAWVLRQLASPLLPFTPFIMTSNAIFVVVFSIFSKKTKVGQYIGYGLGAVLKFIFLYMSAARFVTFATGLPRMISKNLVIMMGLPQLITAFIGGGAALIIINIVEKRYPKSIEG